MHAHALINRYKNSSNACTCTTAFSPPTAPLRIVWIYSDAGSQETLVPQSQTHIHFFLAMGPAKVWTRMVPGVSIVSFALSCLPHAVHLSQTQSGPMKFPRPSRLGTPFVRSTSSMVILDRNHFLAASSGSNGIGAREQFSSGIQKPHVGLKMIPALRDAVFSGSSTSSGSICVISNSGSLASTKFKISRA